MRQLSVFLFAIFFLVACQQREGEVNFTVKDYVQALKNAQMHNIRTERNKKLKEQMDVAEAADVYVGNQHVIIIQAGPGIEGRRYGGMFEGYSNQGWTREANGNLLLVAEPETQKELIEVFQSLRW
jgi:hypothetical protein